jgi:hypothetical protein
MENAMSPSPMVPTLFAAAPLALALRASPASFAATADAGISAARDARDVSPPVMVAAAPMRTDALPAPVLAEPYPAYQRGVRQAADEGNEALRRYVWRTRMIYDFYYYDFANRR